MWKTILFLISSLSVVGAHADETCTLTFSANDGGNVQSQIFTVRTGSALSGVRTNRDQTSGFNIWLSSESDNRGTAEFNFKSFNGPGIQPDPALKIRNNGVKSTVTSDGQLKVLIVCAAGLVSNS
jgi:hypothetical protein